MIRGIIKLPLSLQTSIRSMFLLYNFLYTPTLFLSLPVYLHLPFLPPISTFFLALHPILSPTSQPRLPSIRLLRLNHPCSPQLPYSTRNHVLSLSLSLVGHESMLILLVYNDDWILLRKRPCSRFYPVSSVCQKSGFDWSQSGAMCQ